MKKLIITWVTIFVTLLFLGYAYSEVSTDPGVTGVIPDDYYIKSSDSTVQGTITFSGMTTVFGDYSANNSMNMILCDATAGDVDIHIASSSGAKGRMGNVKKIDSSGNGCIIEPAGAETIDGDSNATMSVQWESLTYISDGSNLLIQ